MNDSQNRPKNILVLRVQVIPDLSTSVQSASCTTDISHKILCISQSQCDYGEFRHAMVARAFLGSHKGCGMLEAQSGNLRVHTGTTILGFYDGRQNHLRPASFPAAWEQ